MNYSQVGRDDQGVPDKHVHTAVFTMENQQGPAVAHGELYGSLDGRGVWGENGYMYTYGWVPLLSTWNYQNIANQQ